MSSLTNVISQRRRSQLRAAAVVAVVALVLVGGRASPASAAPGDITRVGGTYRPQDCLGYPPPVAQPGPAGSAQFGTLKGVAVSADGKSLFQAALANFGPNHDDRFVVYRTNLERATLDVVAGGGTSAADSIPATTAALSPLALAADGAVPTVLYVLDGTPNALQVRKVDLAPAPPTIKTVAAMKRPPVINGPVGLAVDRLGNSYVSYTGIPTAPGKVVKLSPGTQPPSEGTPVSSGLVSPSGLALDLAGRTLYVADAGRFGEKDGAIVSIPLLPSPGAATTIASGLDDPSAVALLNDPKGDRLFVAESHGNKVSERKLEGGEELQRVAGTGAEGEAGDGHAGSAATLRHPNGLAVDKQANIFIQDSDNCVVRMVERMPRFAPPTTTSPPTTSPPTTTAPDAGQPPPKLDAPGNPATQNQSQSNNAADTGNNSVPQSTGDGGQSTSFEPDSSPFFGSDYGYGGGFSGDPFGGGFFTPSGGEVGVGNVAPLGNGFPGLGDVSSAAQQTGVFANQGAAPPAAAPAPPAAPASGFVVGHGQASGGNVGAVGTDGQPPRGAIRYAIVGQSGNPGPLATAAATGLVGFFGCVLIVAAKLDEPNRRRARPDPARSRVKGGY